MKTKIWAHRGASAKAPENTIPAFKLAVKQGADGIELDVQLSKDGIVVVTHDERIDRVSNGTGFVKDYTWKELQEFNFNNGKEEYGFVPIPTLEEVYQIFGQMDLTINVELKTNKFRYEGIEEKVTALSEKYNLGRKVIYSSFSPSTLTKMRCLCPECLIGLIYLHEWADAPKYAIAKKLNAVHPPLKACNQKLVNKCKSYGLDLNIWKVNTMEAFEKMVKFEVNAVITDWPGLFSKAPY